MSESYTLSESQEKMFRSNMELAAIASGIREVVGARWEQLSVLDQFFVSQFGKAQRTFVAIHTLLERGLIEDGLCLLRVLLENTINLGYCIRSDTLQAVGRYFDWAMLDSVRRARACNWFEGTSVYSEDRIAKFLKAEETIRARYTVEDFESLKRNVFGISLERRADIAELRQLYDASYRVSRNVHAMDVAVFEFTRSSSTAEEYSELLEARASHLLDIAQWCLGTLANWMNSQFHCGLEDELQKLQDH